jgi:hypothetical protein
VLLEDAEGEDTNALRLVDGLNEVGASQLFPLRREGGLGGGGGTGDDEKECEGDAERSFHGGVPLLDKDRR